MKLTELYIHNYKSFYDTTIELDKMNIVVGENNSGKSNLIDVLEFIDIARKENFYKAVSVKGGFEKILNYHYNEKKIIIELELEDNFFSIRTRFTVDREVTVVSLIIYTTEDKIPLHINASRYRKNTNSMKEKIYNYTDNLLEFTSDVSLVIFEMKFLNTLNNLSSTYYFTSQIIKESNKSGEDSVLLKDGSNLGKILFDIKEDNSNQFEIISNSLITTVQEIYGIDVKKVFGNYPIGFIEKNSSEPIAINDVSDGTVNFLATITALNQLNNLSLLLVFEEPERHLHSKVVNYLLDSFRSSEKQILITTHSTEMLKYANLDEVVFIYRDSDGDTQSIRADKVPNLKEKMAYMKYERSMTLDEMLDEDMVWDFE